MQKNCVDLNYVYADKIREITLLAQQLSAKIIIIILPLKTNPPFGIKLHYKAVCTIHSALTCISKQILRYNIILYEVYIFLLERQRTLERKKVIINNNNNMTHYNRESPYKRFSIISTELLETQKRHVL